MIRHIVCSLLLLSPLKAQIYADFSVSQGGNPLGTFRVELEHEKAPRTCANFIGLATGKRPWIDQNTASVQVGKPYYDGLTFHRLIHSFVIQGGSPNGLGTDGPGYTILDEYHQDLRHSSAYVLSMAKAGQPNTGGSQFFITLNSAPGLNDKHSVFGKVISNTALIDRFRNSADFPTGANDRPVTPLTMDKVTLSGPDYENFDLGSPSLRLPHVSNTDMKISHDPEANTMTATFNRQPRSEYFFTQSPDLSTWSNPRYIFGSGPASDHSYVLTSRTEPAYFLNLATVDYAQIPDAPTDLLNSPKTLRIKFTDGSSLDFQMDGLGGGTWIESPSLRTGAITSSAWTDQATGNEIYENSYSQAHQLPLGLLNMTISDYFGAGQSGNLVFWLSFHTPTSGWTEELGNNPANRFAFGILSN
ncbi:peptidylprolyl isomerase [Luteolibacter algae]|uniref:peptidylprolyl isomerase n=1 Tax=Luteolibacter algae TaxID=454151 RepID=A0ABW5DA92_9BACT